MRRILVEQARRKRRYKHGGGLVRADIDLVCSSREFSSRNAGADVPLLEAVGSDETLTHAAASARLWQFPT
jgi:hypothetical protein